MNLIDSHNPFLGKVTGHINAGGRGTRIAPALPEEQVHPRLGVSKALLEVGLSDTALIDHHVSRLLRVGFGSIVAAVGDHEHIADHVRHRYSGNPSVHAVSSTEQRGTGGDLIDSVRQHPDLYGDTIYVANVDTILEIDEAAFIEAHRSSPAGVTIALTRNRGVPNQDAFLVGSDNRVLYSTEAASNTVGKSAAVARADWLGSSTGAVVLNRDFIRGLPDTGGEVSLYREIMGYALGQGALHSYDNGNNFFMDIGTAEAWRQIEADPGVIQSYLTR